MRILFIFDPARNAVLLIAGDKSGRWQEWYREAIPAAEAIYEAYLTQAEVAEAMGVSQQRVSAIESGGVAELATLADYIRALGGELKVIADFGDSWRRVA